ncbi:transposase [Mycolicibacterium vaccae ATCC 25954]|uniref:Transposase n=1 Tax=Mycolicibacterium vaccae ATCC 25954 TaxID=1194972 RepID=K0UR81_MYCVA|nr:transposase [Mycolicibacterium vaccae 95051]EJZ05113.1 transposase [Mycolicibacterium vaccae ATCC 25954]
MIVARIESLRRVRKYSSARIAFELRAEGVTISRRTVSRQLLALGLNRRKFIDPNGEANREPRKIIARRPGHMVHLDVKKVGRIPDGGGWRAHGRGSEQAKAAEQSKRKTKRGGCVYLHSAIDGYSRLAYTEALSDEKADTAIAFMHRAPVWFAAHGITRIERVVTDNGACYRAEAFAHALAGPATSESRPTPRATTERWSVTTGSSTEEFLYARTWTSEDQRREALRVWNIHYNYHRPHSATDGAPPASRLPATVSNVMASYS